MNCNNTVGAGAPAWRFQSSSHALAKQSSDAGAAAPVTAFHHLATFSRIVPGLFQDCSRTFRTWRELSFVSAVCEGGVTINVPQVTPDFR